MAAGHGTSYALAGVVTGLGVGAASLGVTEAGHRSPWDNGWFLTGVGIWCLAAVIVILTTAHLGKRWWKGQDRPPEKAATDATTTVPDAKPDFTAHIKVVESPHLKVALDFEEWHPYDHRALILGVKVSVENFTNEEQTLGPFSGKPCRRGPWRLRTRPYSVSGTGMSSAIRAR